MCGILGCISFSQPIEDLQPALRQGLNNISHRGPDGSGEMIRGYVYLGHRRLSIIDLTEAAAQPLKSRTAEASIIYNGEVYNFKELLKELPGFQSNSDTEVILEGYLRYGKDFFRKLRGIYAFAILDYRNPSDEKLILMRDPSGIKPLYVYQSKDIIAFGSEIKSIYPLVRQKLTINENILKAYLHLSFCLEPFTIYNEITTLEPGFLWEISLASHNIIRTQLNKYTFEKENNLSLQENIQQTKELLSTAVNRNLISDVELSLALSGGIDSSLIFALANKGDRKYKGITVAFGDKDYDESPTASIYARTIGAPHEIIKSADSEDHFDILNKVATHFDQPYADSSMIPFYLLTKTAKQVSTVLIGGDGADETHNGYTSSTWLPSVGKISSSVFLRGASNALISIGKMALGADKKRQLGRIQLLINSKRMSDVLLEWQSWMPPHLAYQGKSPFNYNLREVSDFYHSLFSDVQTSTFENEITLDNFYKRQMSDYLRKSDMMSMLNSVEFRVPMLDEDLVQFSLTIPYKFKSDLKQTKKILRAIHGDIFPPETSNAPKRGFTIPLDKWLGLENFRRMEAIIRDPNSIVFNYISKDYVDFLFKSLYNNQYGEISRASAYQRILILYSLENWHINR